MIGTALMTPNDGGWPSDAETIPNCPYSGSGVSLSAVARHLSLQLP